MAWLSVLGLLAASCSPVGGTHVAAPLPPPPGRLDVTMREYAFDHVPTVAPGRTVFHVRNTGSVVHELVLSALPDDFPPIADQLRGDVRRPLGILDRLANRPPGSTDVFAVDLAPGRYAMVCFRTDLDGIQHATKGMSSEFRVVGDKPPR